MSKGKWATMPLDGLTWDGGYRSLVGQITTTGDVVSHGGAKQMSRRFKAARARIAQNRPQEATPAAGAALPPWEDGWSRKAQPAASNEGWLDTPEGYEQPIGDLIEARKGVYHRAMRAAKAPPAVKLSDPGPYAILHFGDPHVDDDGCNWDLLQSHVRLVQCTPHMYGGQLGDVVNGWVGRLERLYKHQTTTEDEAFRLAHWLMSAIPWI